VRLVPQVATGLIRGEVVKVSSGEQVRDFLHVADVAAGIVHVALGDVEGPVNIASGEPIRVRDLVARIAKLCGREDLVAYGALPARPGDPASVFANVEKAKAIGFRPALDLDAGLREVVAELRRGPPVSS
jgi:nucleoside-diphosphate-sugar epimerase